MPTQYAFTKRTCGMYHHLNINIITAILNIFFARSLTDRLGPDSPLIALSDAAHTLRGQYINCNKVQEASDFAISAEGRQGGAGYLGACQTLSRGEAATDSFVERDVGDPGEAGSKDQRHDAEIPEFLDSVAA
ncbi:hypothetical protein B0H17DRAFT_1131024 [Mycena rosella]|uniref:Uncharacterized protein n=1 Tax=Mycena rosella TaxID=1033263 RepID=A0AAD7DPC0_MYCRO|nr:hypothetical protein B0H17DRAFT_1131024 [Mycena rosella]